MAEQIIYFGLFLACLAVLVNLMAGGALLRHAERLWRDVRAIPAARRRRAYLENEFRSTRKHTKRQAQSRSTLDH